MEELINELINAEEFENVTNQYSGKWQHHNIARKNIKLYLEKMFKLKPKLILVGEAPGYNGCRLTGIPFTSEYIVKDEICNIGLFGVNNGYLIRKGVKPQKERTATIVWDVLNTIEKYPLLWNAFPYHPYKPGCTESNRKPNKKELEHGINILKKIIKIFNIKKIIAVGNVSYNIMVRHKINCIKIRHPSNGGKVEFTNGLNQVFANNSECYGKN